MARPAYHVAMCVNFIPPDPHQLRRDFGLDAGDQLWPESCWQDYPAPIIVKGRQGEPALQLASYGMVPKRHQPAGVRISTLNARAETVAQRVSFRRAWQQLDVCLVPMQHFFEPCYRSGRAERWQIGMADGQPFAVAGLWRSWLEPDGSLSHAFTQLTINADQHPLMRHMHKPGDEKRSLVIIPPERNTDWLNCADPESACRFLTLYPAEWMAAAPAPLKPVESAPVQGGLFD